MSGEWFKDLDELRAKALLDSSLITTGLEMDRQRELRSLQEENAKRREEQRRKDEGIHFKKGT